MRKLQNFGIEFILTKLQRKKLKNLKKYGKTSDAKQKNKNEKNNNNKKNYNINKIVWKFFKMFEKRVFQIE